MGDDKGLNQIRREVLVACSIIFSVIMAIAVIPRASTPGGGRAVALAGVWVGVSMFTLVLARSGRWLRVSSFSYCIALYAVITLLQLNVGFFPAPASVGFFVVPALAGFLLGGATGLAFGFFGCGIAVALKVSLPPWNDPNFVALSGTFLLVICLVSIGLPALIAVYDRSHRSVNEELSRARAEAFGARAEALEASAAKSEFLANMSHDLRTPMNGVIALLQLVLEEPLADGVRHHLDLASRSASSLMRLLSDILDFTKIERGALSIVNSSFDLRAEIVMLIDLYSISAKAKDLALEATVDPELPVHVHCDQLRLRQILNNLVTNAIKYTHRGSVTLRVSLVHDDAGEQRLRFELRDTGRGIAPQEQGAAFAAFERGSADSSHPGLGLGLGLAIVTSLVELMGGDIALESEADRGSTFIVTLPYRPGTGSSEAEERRAEAPTPSLHVLIVEDDPVSQLVLKSVLEHLGASAVIAASGVKALELLAVPDAAFDLVFMDINMPGLDGYETTRRILSRPTAPIPIVGLSAQAFAQDRKRGEDVGMRAYLTKPILLEDVAGVLRECAGAEAGRGVETD